MAQIDQRGASWWWEDRKQKRERNFPFELARAAMQIQVLMAAGVGIVEKWRSGEVEDGHGSIKSEDFGEEIEVLFRFSR